jgi:hypothetical protein
MLRAVLDEGMALGAPSLLPEEDARPPAKRTRQDTPPKPAYGYAGYGGHGSG